MKDVQGKVAVVTGAASGIGRGMAQSFVAAGMKVVLADIREEPLVAPTDALRAEGADVHAVVTDVSKEDQVRALAEAALEQYGGVNVLCNNAGFGVGGKSTWEASLDTSVCQR